MGETPEDEIKEWGRRCGVDEDYIEKLIEMGYDYDRIINELKAEWQTGMRDFLSKNPTYDFDKVFKRNITPVVKPLIEWRIVPEITGELETKRVLDMFVTKTVIIERDRDITYEGKKIGKIGKTISKDKEMITKYKRIGVRKLSERQLVRLQSHINAVKSERGKLRTKREVRKYLTIPTKALEKRKGMK